MKRQLGRVVFVFSLIILWLHSKGGIKKKREKSLIGEWWTWSRGREAGSSVPIYQGEEKLAYRTWQISGLQHEKVEEPGGECLWLFDNQQKYSILFFSA